MDDTESQPFEPVPTELHPRPDLPLELARIETVSVRVTLPGSAAAAIAAAFPGTIEDGILSACATAVKLGLAGSQTRPIVLTDEHRRQLEEIVAVNLFSPEQLLERVRRMADIAICTHAGDELLTIRLEPIVVERLHTRSVGKFHEYVRDTIGGLIRQFVNM